MTPNQKPVKFLIVGFDGLRPDFVTAEEMPRLAAFAASAHRWSNYLAAFPTETYVNHPSIFSGFRPNRHGVIANEFYNPSHKAQGASEKLFSGWSIPSVMAQDRIRGGLYEVPDMAARLARDGKTLRVLCSNSPGSTRLQNIHADRYEGQLNCCAHAVLQTLPAKEAKMLASELGDGVPLKFPDFDGTELITKLFLEREAQKGAEGLGDVTVVWIGEPDHSQHEFGLRAEETRRARAHADRCFGKILDWWEREGRDNNVQLITLSDHGHGEVARNFSLKEALEEKGWQIADAADIRAGRDLSGCDAVLVGGYTAGLWVRNPQQSTLVRLADDLMSIPDVGLLFSQPKVSLARNLVPSDIIEGRVPGTFSEALVSSDSDRGPDLRIVPRGDPATGQHVMQGLAVGSGNHGGLNPQETHAFLAVAGSKFAGMGLHEEPASHDDLAATVMTLLDLLDDEAQAPLPTGRLLGEALETGCVRKGTATREVLSLERGSYRQELTRLVYEGRPYVEQGRRTSEDGWTPSACLGECQTDDHEA